MKKKNLYIHIGTCKTGSTSIQSFLYKNADSLKEKGLFYPKIEFSKDYLESYYFSEYVNFRPLFLDFNDLKSKINQTLWITQYYPQIINCEAENILLSEEVLSYHQDLSIFDDPAFSAFNVKIIVYFRKYVEYMCSMWTESVKPILRHKFGRKSLQEFLSEDVFPYGLLKDYIKKFGAENIIFRPFEKEQWHKNDLISDFLNIFNIDKDENFIEAEKENEGFSRNVAEISRLINELHLNDYNTHLVSIMFYNKNISTKPKAIETLTDNEIKYFTDANQANELEIANLLGLESLFISPYPSIYGKERPPYNKITLTFDELEILKEAIRLKNNTWQEASEKINNIFRSIND